MAFYKRTYMPGFTTNDTYGNFYDGKKASLITVPEGLKNYALDVRNSHSSTAGAEYGNFLTEQQAMQLQRLQQEHEQRQPQWPLKPYNGAYSQQEPLEALERQRVALPPPPPPPLPDPEPLASSREPPPPVSVERYRNPAAAGMTPRDSKQLQQQQQQRQQHHLRSQSPPPPPDLGTYRNNMEVYTGRSGGGPAGLASQRSRSPPAAPSPPKRVLQAPPPPPPPPPPPAASTGESQLPVLRYGAREIRLPDIEAVELHMRDKSKVILNVREFYNRYLRD